MSGQRIVLFLVSILTAPMQCAEWMWDKARHMIAFEMINYYQTHGGKEDGVIVRDIMANLYALSDEYTHNRLSAAYLEVAQNLREARQ